MNKCLQCINLHKEGKRYTCSKHTEVTLYGELYNEPLVEACGAYQQMRVYRIGKEK